MEIGEEQYRNIQDLSPKAKRACKDRELDLIECVGLPV
jgi:hypothetical protein